LLTPIIFYESHHTALRDAATGMTMGSTKKVEGEGIWNEEEREIKLQTA